MKKNIYNNSRTLISDEIAAQSQGRAVSFYVDGFNLYHSVKDIKEAHINHKPINPSC